jgi:hypothetical protein
MHLPQRLAANPQPKLGTVGAHLAVEELVRMMVQLG